MAIQFMWIAARPFSRQFRSVPSFGIGSSAELEMLRNEHFLPRNNGNHSESILRNFFGTKFHSQPYLDHVPFPLSICVVYFYDIFANLLLSLLVCSRSLISMLISDYHLQEMLNVTSH